MTMHMVHPGLTTVNTGKSKKKPNATQIKAAKAHEEWLRSRGLHQDQLIQRKDKGPKKLKPSFSVDRSGPQCNNGFAPGGAKKSLFDSQWKDTYTDPLLAEREKEALKKAENRKSMLMPLYNKGPIQLQTDLKNLTDGNGRGRR